MHHETFVEDRKMPQKPVIWHNGLTLEFIEHYKSESMLWNPNHNDHKNKPALSHAWERIRANMSKDISIIDLKKKKESLMTAYRLNNRRRREDPEMEISWFAFEPMDAFLGSIYNPPDNSSDQEDNAEETEFITNRLIKKEKPERSSAPSAATSNFTSTHPLPRKRPKEVSFSYIAPEIENDDFDECELYARLLAKKMRKLDERQRDIVMHEIDNILFRAKMNSDRYSSPSSSSKVKKVKPPESPVFIVTESNEYEEEYLEDLNDNGCNL